MGNNDESHSTGVRPVPQAERRATYPINATSSVQVWWLPDRADIAEHYSVMLNWSDRPGDLFITHGGIATVDEAHVIARRLANAVVLQNAYVPNGVEPLTDAFGGPLTDDGPELDFEHLDGEPCRGPEHGLCFDHGRLWRRR